MPFASAANELGNAARQPLPSRRTLRFQCDGVANIGIGVFSELWEIQSALCRRRGKQRPHDAKRIKSSIARHSDYRAALNFRRFEHGFPAACLGSGRSDRSANELDHSRTSLFYLFAPDGPIARRNTKWRRDCYGIVAHVQGCAISFYVNSIWKGL